MTVPSMSPIQLARRFGRGGGGGPIWATGLPKRVTKMGFFVFRTCSRTDRQVALNFEIAISSTPRLHHGQTSGRTGCDVRADLL